MMVLRATAGPADRIGSRKPGSTPDPSDRIVGDGHDDRNPIDHMGDRTKRGRQAASPRLRAITEVAISKPNFPPAT